MRIHGSLLFLACLLAASSLYGREGYISYFTRAFTAKASKVEYPHASFEWLNVEDKPAKCAENDWQSIISIIKEDNERAFEQIQILQPQIQRLEQINHRVESNVGGLKASLNVLYAFGVSRIWLWGIQSIDAVVSRAVFSLVKLAHEVQYVNAAKGIALVGKTIKPVTAFFSHAGGDSRVAMFEGSYCFVSGFFWVNVPSAYAVSKQQSDMEEFMSAELASFQNALKPVKFQMSVDSISSNHQMMKAQFEKAHQEIEDSYEKMMAAWPRWNPLGLGKNALLKAQVDLNRHQWHLALYLAEEAYTEALLHAFDKNCIYQR